MLKNQVRIIGGKWGGRKIAFPSTLELRPTPDRIRETLFNWLAPYIVDACCLDLFAGSGVLGFEALSRGAKQVVNLEKDKKVFQVLQENAERLNIEANALQLVHQDALSWLKNQNDKKDLFDIVFVDPPYQANLLGECLGLLENGNWIAERGLIYFEDDQAVNSIDIPKSWEILKEKKAGQVYYYLARKFVAS